MGDTNEENEENEDHAEIIYNRNTQLPAWRFLSERGGIVIEIRDKVDCTPLVRGISSVRKCLIKCLNCLMCLIKVSHVSH